MTDVAQPAIIAHELAVMEVLQARYHGNSTPSNTANLFLFRRKLDGLRERMLHLY